MVCKCKFDCGTEGRDKTGCSCTGGGSHACLGLRKLCQRVCQEAVDGIETKQAEENEWIEIGITVTVKIPSKKKGTKKKDEKEDEEEEKDLPKGSAED